MQSEPNKPNQNQNQTKQNNQFYFHCSGEPVELQTSSLESLWRVFFAVQVVGVPTRK